MAEWLGTALQKLLQRFESASDLTKTALEQLLTLFFFCFVRQTYLLRIDIALSDCSSVSPSYGFVHIKYGI